MQIDIHERDGIVVIEMAGRWDAQSSPEIETQILSQIQSGNRAVMDLANVNYLSSAGLRTLLLIYREVADCGDCRLVLTRVNERMRDVMEITGFIDHFELYDTLEEGLAALRA